MKKILYIGNKLSVHDNNLSYIETLGPLLEESGYYLVYSSNKKNKGLRFLDMVATLSRRRDKIDLVIIDTYSTLNYWYAIAIGKLCHQFHIPYIPILHGGNLPARAKKSAKTFSTFVENSFISICPSNFLKEKLAELGYLNTSLIKNTVDISDYKFNLRSSLKPNLLWVRSFSKIYNPEMAIHVFNRIKVNFPEATLCMIGPDKDGSLETTKVLAEKMNLDVKFTGKMTKEAWRNKSEEFDIFINTTHFDNLPISVIESMALGLPVVSTNVGGIPYLIENMKTGLLVEDNNVDQMVAAIEQLLTDQQFAASISQAAREEAEKYDWENVKEDWNKLLSTVPQRT